MCSMFSADLFYTIVCSIQHNTGVCGQNVWIHVFVCFKHKGVFFLSLQTKTTRAQTSFKDLCPEDKRRIANLIEELARRGIPMTIYSECRLKYNASQRSVFYTTTPQNEHMLPRAQTANDILLA